ncbi:MAG: HlyD family efflux transporter periplasmic adaptor subunit, partial [Caulobacterales bacterium]|nr:HlyD family efflux transporter periplasmic adaptor subunit [Caulobacterales bacterium]
ADYVYVAAPDAGWLTEVAVARGDEVAPGDPLFALDAEREAAAVAEARNRLVQAEAELANLTTGRRPEEIAALRARHEEARASLRLADSELVRWRELVERGVAPNSRLDQVQADRDAAAARAAAAERDIAVAELAARDDEIAAARAAEEAARAALDQALWRLGQRAVASRVAGRVEDVYHRAGEFVTAGAPIASLLPPGNVKVRFFAPQEQLSRYAVGAPIAVACDGCAAPIAATVAFIAREAEFTPPVIYSADSRDTLVFLIEAEPEPGASLTPGQPVDVVTP